jgi:hypothetical protein
MYRHQPIRDYFTRRLAEGKTKNEIMRCVKRYIARQICQPAENPAEEPTNSLPEQRASGSRRVGHAAWHLRSGLGAVEQSALDEV